MSEKTLRPLNLYASAHRTDTVNGIQDLRTLGQQPRPGTPSGGNIIASTQPRPGIPKHVRNVSVTARPIDNKTSRIQVSFMRDPGDPFYEKANVFIIGHKGNPSPVQVASGDSPISFDIENDAVPVSFRVQATGGLGSAYLTTAPSASLRMIANNKIGPGSPLAKPAAPSNLTATSNPLGNVLQWTAPSGGSYVVGYHVYRATTASFAAAVKHGTQIFINGGTVKYTDQSALPGVGYAYYVTAINLNDVEGPPASVSITTSKVQKNGVNVVNVPTNVTNAITSPATGNSGFVVPGWINFQGYVVASIIDVFVDAGSNTGYMFRLDGRNGSAIGQIFRVTNITTLTVTNIGTAYVANNTANMVQWYDVECYMGPHGYACMFVNGTLVVDATDTTYTPNGTLKYGKEVANGKIADGVTQRAGSSFLSGQGSIASISDNTFSYTSTTSSINWSWTSFVAYSPDGSSFTVSNGSQNFTGLTSSSTYYFGFYVLTSNHGNSGTAQVVMSDVGSGKSPESLAQIVGTVNGDGNIPISIQVTAATPGSGTGSGGGGTVHCFSPATLVKTQRGDVAISEVLSGKDTVLTARGTWKTVLSVVSRKYSGPALVMNAGELITPNHRVLIDANRLSRSGEGKLWERADKANLDFPQTYYSGRVCCLFVDADETDDGTAVDTERSFTLSNGLVAHNLSVF